MTGVLGSWTLPLREASGLAVRPDAAGAALELVAVEDDLFAVATASIRGGVLTPAPRAADVTAAMQDAGAHKGGSDFEGVAADGTGKLFLLQEDAARIVVLDADLAAVAAIVPLVVRPDDPVVGTDWHGGRNARGEGLVLLRSGHVLLAMLAAWPIGGDRLAGINDLAAGPDGRLHAVSSATRCLATIAVDLRPPGGTATVEARPLPADMFGGRKRKAEGLVWAPGLGWLVALDIGRIETNLFCVEDVP